MGHGLAKNIAKAGFSLKFLQHPGNQPVDDLYEIGGTSTPSINDIVKQSNVVFICVTGSAQVADVVMGENGFLNGLEPGTIIVDCSTVEPHVTGEVAKKIIDAGGQFLDAPLTRTPKEAEQGRVNVMVGGDATTLHRVRPLLDSFAENIYHAGPIGTGATLKLLHNYISLGNSVLLAEAVVSAKLSGVDIDTFIDVLATGGGDSTALKRLTPYISGGDIGGFRFSIANAAKDTGYYKSLANHIGAPSVTAEAIQRVFQDALDMGDGAKPVPKLIDLLSEPRPRKA